MSLCTRRAVEILCIYKKFFYGLFCGKSLMLLRIFLVWIVIHDFLFILKGQVHMSMCGVFVWVYLCVGEWMSMCFFKQLQCGTWRTLLVLILRPFFISVNFPFSFENYFNYCWYPLFTSYFSWVYTSSFVDIVISFYNFSVHSYIFTQISFSFNYRM